MGHHKKKKKHKSKHKRRSSSSSDSPEEPSKRKKMIGPCLPTVLQASRAPSTVLPTLAVPASVPASTSTHSDSYGPQLPPHLSGPQLPPHLSKPKQPDLETRSSQQVQEDDDDDGNIIGPLPANLQGSSSTQQALDERAEILKYEFLLKGTGDDDITHRESWMTELPPEKANYFGLGARKFRTSTNTGDPKNRHLWTETPLDKNKPQQQEPVDETSTFEELVVEQRNKLMDQIVKKNEGKKEKKSLLEIHREKLKKNKQKTKDGKQERRPFDRDVDLEVNKFDEAQKKSMLKRAQLLDSKFAHGKSKYL